jgi:hypothetical protein
MVHGPTGHCDRLAAVEFPSATIRLRPGEELGLADARIAERYTHAAT